MTFVVVDTGNTRFIIKFDPRNGSTTGFQNLGAVIVGNPSCVNTASEEVICAVVGLNNALFAFAGPRPPPPTPCQQAFDSAQQKCADVNLVLDPSTFQCDFVTGEAFFECREPRVQCDCTCERDGIISHERTEERDENSCSSRTGNECTIVE